MKKLKVLKTLVAATLSLGLLVGCSGMESAPETTPGATEEAVESVGTLVLSEMSASGAVPVIIAHENGYFDKYGVTVEHVNTGDPTQLVAAIQAGEIDGAGSDIITAINLNAAGSKTYMTSKTDGRFIVAGNKTLEEIQANDGPIKVGISKNNIIEYIKWTL